MVDIITGTSGIACSSTLDFGCVYIYVCVCVQNSSIIPFYWLVYRDAPFLVIVKQQIAVLNDDSWINHSISNWLMN